jgi:hypothetical protein
LGERREDLLEEHRDVLPGQALDRLAIAVRAIGDGLARPEELDHASPIHRGGHRVDELAAEELGALVVEEDLGDVGIDGQAAVLEDGEIVGVTRPGPGSDRLAVGLGDGSQILGGDAIVAGSADAREQAQLDTEIDQPRSMEPGQAGDEVVEAVLVAHRGIVAWASAAEATAGYLGSMQRSDERRGSSR